jgi:MYXO-CTERM domain-containing protein
MRPIGYRRILRAAATTILLAVPAVKAGQVTVDLGTVGYSIGISASIMNSDYPLDTETYAYQQLIFGGPLSMVVDGSGDTLAFVLAEDLGNANNGTLDYNFPFPLGASGSYAQTSPPGTFDTPDPGTVSLSYSTMSGHACPGDNTPGSVINLDPNQAAVVYAAILGCDGLAPITEGGTYMTSTVTLPPLGTVTNGDTTTTYIGEFTDYEWTLTAADGPASATPEPSSLWLGASGIALLGWRRFRRRSGQSPP